jgi:hypothetical protein
MAKISTQAIWHSETEAERLHFASSSTMVSRSDVLWDLLALHENISDANELLGISLDESITMANRFLRLQLQKLSLSDRLTRERELKNDSENIDALPRERQWSLVCKNGLSAEDKRSLDEVPIAKPKNPASADEVPIAKPINHTSAHDVPTSLIEPLHEAPQTAVPVGVEEEQWQKVIHNSKGLTKRARRANWKEKQRIITEKVQQEQQHGSHAPQKTAEKK